MKFLLDWGNQFICEVTRPKSTLDDFLGLISESSKSKRGEEVYIVTQVALYKQIRQDKKGKQHVGMSGVWWCRTFIYQIRVKFLSRGAN